MDSAHISLCSLLMRTGLFKKFQCPEPISLGINLRTLAMVLNGIHGELRMKSDGNKLQLRVVKLDGIADYTLNLMDIDCENLGLPDTEYQCTCILPSNTFAKVVKDVQNFSDTCSLKINQELCLSVAGDLEAYLGRAVTTASALFNQKLTPSCSVSGTCASSRKRLPYPVKLS